MFANLDSRLDSVMKFLEDMGAETKKEFEYVKKEIGTLRKELGTAKQELGTVKEELGTVKAELGVVNNKCIQIEMEILGITAEAKVNPEALMETMTVRQLIGNKLTFNVGTLRVESNNAIAAAERQKENRAACKNLYSEFSAAKDEKIKNLQQKYDVMTRKTFQAEFSHFLVEFRSETEKELQKQGISSSVMHGVLDDLAKTVGSDELYDEHFLEKYKEMERIIREKYEGTTEIYAKRAVFRMDNYESIAHTLISEFLNKWKLCTESFDRFRKELLQEFQEIADQIEFNRELLERLCYDFQDCLFRKPKDVIFMSLREGSFDIMEKEIKVSNPKLIEIFMEKLSRNMYDISAWGGGFCILHDNYFDV